MSDMKSADPILYLASSLAQKDRLAGLVRDWDSSVSVHWLHSKEDLDKAMPEHWDRLIAFNTGLIIPQRLLDRFILPSINFHAASPEFPGRDPHHWAIYHGATEYGVTAHIMTSKVDDGPIVAVDRFPIQPYATPQQLREMATEVLFGLFRRLLPFAAHRLTTDTWGKKSSRAHTLAMADLTGCDAGETARRIQAFSGFMK